MKTNATLFSILLFVFLYDLFWNNLYLYILQHSTRPAYSEKSVSFPPHPPSTQFPFQKATTLTSFLSILHKLYEIFCCYTTIMCILHKCCLLYTLFYTHFSTKYIWRSFYYQSIIRCLHLSNDSLMFYCTHVRKYT